MEDYYLLYLVHLSYFFTLVSLSFRNLHWLRLFSILSSMVAIYYSLLCTAEPLWVPTIWHMLFTLVNLGQLLLTRWRARDVDLNPLETFLSKTALLNFPSAEVKSFTKIGQVVEVASGSQLIQSGAELKELYCILKGSVDVYTTQEKIVALNEGCFVGEMSLLTKSVTRANVVAANPLRLVVWPHEEIERWVDADAQRLTLLQTALGTQIVEQLLKQTPEGEIA